MRLLIIAILSILPLSAADIPFSADVTIVDDPATTGIDEAQEAVAAVNAWRLAQLNDDGSLVYPTNQALAAAILEERVEDIIRAACNQGLSCPTAVQAQYDAASSAEAAKATAIDDAITIE